MRLPAEERSRLERRLGNADDALTASNIIETIVNHVRASNASALARLHYELEVPEGGDRYTVQLTQGFALFTYEYARVLSKASSRVLDVRLNCRDRCIEVVVARASLEQVPDAVVYAAPAAKKMRHVETDYDSFDVECSRDDRRVITELVDAVYNAVARVPANMAFWFEGVHEHGGDDVSAVSRANDDDASVSEAPSGAILGYSLCFSRAPVLSLAFLEYLMREYAASVASSYVWFSPPERVEEQGDALFVINIRSSKTSVASTKRAVKANLPRGIVAPSGPSKKRVRKA